MPEGLRLLNRAGLYCAELNQAASAAEDYADAKDYFDASMLLRELAQTWEVDSDV